MKYYCIRSKKTNKYIAGNDPGTFHITAVQKNALSYKDEVKIRNIIKNLPKRLDIFGPFESVGFDVEEENQVEPNNTPEIEGIDLKQVKDDINDFSIKLKKIIDNREELLQQLSDVDLELSDIEHYIENNKFSACDGYKLAKMIQDKRKQRRIIKDKIKVIDTIKTESCSGIFNGRLVEKLDKLGQWKYTPRVLINLFEQKQINL